MNHSDHQKCLSTLCSLPSDRRHRCIPVELITEPRHHARHVGEIRRRKWRRYTGRSEKLPTIIRAQRVRQLPRGSVAEHCGFFYLRIAGKGARRGVTRRDLRRPRGRKETVRWDYKGYIVPRQAEDERDRARE